MPKPRHNDRTCVATRATLAPGDLAIRFVASPEGQLIADLSEKLPARGAWLVAEQGLLVQAVEKGAFPRALRTEINWGDVSAAAFAEHVGRQLRARTLERLGLARKAGVVITGADTISRKATSIKAYVFAEDAADDGVRKVRARLASVPQKDQLRLPVAADAIGGALGDDGIVHVGLLGGKAAANALWECHRLLSFLGPSAAKSH